MALSSSSTFFDVIGSNDNLTMSTHYVIKGLTKGVTYKFRYRAKNAIGWGGFSAVTYYTPSTTPSPPPVPTFDSALTSSS